MVSALSSSRSHRPSRRQTWPADGVVRWALRLGFAAPLLLLSLRIQQLGFVGSSQAELQARLDRTLGAPNLTGLADAYPPLPLAGAALVPGNPLIVSLFSAIVAGTALQVFAARMMGRQLRPTLIIVLMGTVAASPAFWFEATEQFGAFTAGFLLVMAVDGYLRFIARDDTLGGFSAGLFLAAAVLSHPVAIIYATLMAITVPSLVARSGGSEPVLVRATINVLLFPAVAAMVTWAFLEWRFAGTAFAALEFSPQWPTSTAAISSIVDRWGLAIVSSPLYLAVGALLIRRSVRVAVGYAVVTIALPIALIVGIEHSPIQASLMLTMVALLTSPRRTTRVEEWGLGMACLAQVVVAVALADRDDEFARWLELVRSVGSSVLPGF